MKIYVLTLDNDIGKQRKEKLLNEFDKYEITNFEFVNGIHGESLSDDQVNKIYSDKHSIRIYRSLSRGEIGCAYSLQKIYKKILNDNNSCRSLIIEDDVTLTSDIKKIKDECFEFNNIDIIFFGGSSSNIEEENDNIKSYNYKILKKCKTDRNQTSRVYLTHNKITINGLDIHEVDNRCYQLDFIAGTYGFSLSQEGCKKMLDYNTPIRVPADQVWNYLPFNGIYWFKKDIAIHPPYNKSNIQSDRTELTRYELSKLRDITINNNITSMYNEKFIMRILDPEFGT